MSSKNKVLNITGESFENLISEHDIVFVDFWAKWCSPCKNFAPIYEKTAELYSNVIFAQVDIEKEQELTEIFEIRSIPHLMVFKKGIAIYSESGSMPESTLKELVEQAVKADVSTLE